MVKSTTTITNIVGLLFIIINISQAVPIADFFQTALQKFRVNETAVEQHVDDVTKQLMSNPDIQHIFTQIRNDVSELIKQIESEEENQENKAGEHAFDQTTVSSVPSTLNWTGM